ncbi:MAG TPA: hypothetical protein VGJ32_17500, partial [Solirubrobacteraceae bacterium]
MPQIEGRPIGHAAQAGQLQDDLEQRADQHAGHQAEWADEWSQQQRAKDYPQVESAGREGRQK